MTDHFDGDIGEACNVTVIVPLAGRATRARAITGDQIPKSLIRLGNGQTVLEAMCCQLQGVGFRKFVFCVGHLKHRLMSQIVKETWIRDSATTYVFDETDCLLGPSGTVLHAINTHNLTGQALAVAGDVMLPWNNLADMNRWHASSHADVTIGVTSCVTERTGDIGKLVVEDRTNRLLSAHGRDSATPPLPPRARHLTAAAANVFTVPRFSELFTDYRRNNPQTHDQPLSLRDDVLPWAIVTGAYKLQAYDLQGETLDLGTPDTIRYGQLNWRRYLPVG